MALTKAVFRTRKFYAELDFDMLNPAHREFLRLTEKNLKLGMGYDEAWQTAHRHITRNKNG